MSAPARVREEKRRLIGDTSVYEGERVHLDGAAGHLVYHFAMTHEARVGDLRLPANGHTFGFFWTDRPYNIYCWLDAAGRPLALYFNVSDQTRVAPTEVAWRDLVLDVLVPVGPAGVAPDGAAAASAGAATATSLGAETATSAGATTAAALAGAATAASGGAGRPWTLGEPQVLDRHELPGDLDGALAAYIERALTRIFADLPAVAVEVARFIDRQGRRWLAAVPGAPHPRQP